MTAVLELNKKAKPINKWAEYIPENVLDSLEKVDFVGSYYTCVPQPDTDIDILCLMKKGHNIVADGIAPLLGAGFSFHDGYDMADFTSVRKGKINLILTMSPVFFDRFIRARNVCKLLNVMDKKMRIKIHTLIMKEKYENQW